MMDSRARCTSWSMVQSSTATPTTGQVKDHASTIDTKAEGHHSSKIPSDPEHDQDICYSISGGFDSQRHVTLRLCGRRSSVYKLKAGASW